MSYLDTTWRKLMDCYLKGSITEHEFSWRVFTCLDEDNIKSFLDNATIHCVDLMMARLKTEPTTDEEWDKMTIAGMEWRQENTKPTLAFVRKGVEAVRRHLDKVPALKCLFCGSTASVNPVTLDCYKCYQQGTSWQPWNWPG